jgi:hypothetical protein
LAVRTAAFELLRVTNSKLKLRTRALRCGGIWDFEFDPYALLFAGEVAPVNVGRQHQVTSGCGSGGGLPAMRAIQQRTSRFVQKLRPAMITVGSGKGIVTNVTDASLRLGS